MTLDDLPSFFNATPIYELTSAGETIDMKVDFNADFITSIVEFLSARKYAAAMLSQERPILGAVTGGPTIISERSVLSFEMDDLLRLLITDEAQNDLNLAGKSEREEIAISSTGQQIAYKIVVSFEPGYPKAVYFQILGTDAVDEFNVVRELDGQFAVKHTGAMFTYSGFMVEKTFDEMLRFTTDQKASDITVQPGIPVFARIGADYLPVTETPLNTDEIDRIVRHIYGPSGPAEVLGGAALDPPHEVFVKRVGRTRFRVNITGGRYRGTSSAEISLRALPTIPHKLGSLNIEPALIRNVIRSKTGLILFGGATGSGKSTLMSSFTRELLEAPNSNMKIVEFSEPVEFIYDGIERTRATIWQTNLGKELIAHYGTSDFAEALKNAMRRNPDLIIIGEARDIETMQATISASMSGHQVFATMHCATVDEVIQRAVGMFPPDVRYQMSLDIMQQLRVACTQKLVEKVGGGRVAVREFMVFGHEIRAAFLREDPSQWPRMVRGMLAEERAIGQTMTQGAMKLYRAGQITEETFEEVAGKGRGF